jgi:hypothetical protein
MTGKYPGRFLYAALSVYRGNNTNTNRDSSSSNVHRYSKTSVANNKLAI